MKSILRSFDCFENGKWPIQRKKKLFLYNEKIYKIFLLYFGSNQNAEVLNSWEKHIFTLPLFMTFLDVIEVPEQDKAINLVSVIMITLLFNKAAELAMKPKSP
jgi:hypothetical protein